MNPEIRSNMPRAFERPCRLEETKQSRRMEMSNIEQLHAAGRSSIRPF